MRNLYIAIAAALLLGACTSMSNDLNDWMNENVFNPAVELIGGP